MNANTFNVEQTLENIGALVTPEILQKIQGDYEGFWDKFWEANPNK